MSARRAFGTATCAVPSRASPALLPQFSVEDFDHDAPAFLAPVAPLRKYKKHASGHLPLPGFCRVSDQPRRSPGRRRCRLQWRIGEARPTYSEDEVSDARCSDTRGMVCTATEFEGRRLGQPHRPASSSFGGDDVARDSSGAFGPRSRSQSKGSRRSSFVRDRETRPAATPGPTTSPSEVRLRATEKPGPREGPAIPVRGAGGGGAPGKGVCTITPPKPQ